VFRYETMTLRIALVFLIAAELLRVSASAAQMRTAAATTHSHGAANYSEEPYVVERYRTVVRFENDGTGERATTARIRIQSETGAQKFNELLFPYNADNEQVEIRSVVVRKASGETSVVPTGAVKDGPLASGSDASKYPGQMAKRVSLQLISGDLLDYQVATRIVTPFAPNEFWLQYDFATDAIVLEEELELNLPPGRTFSLKSPGYSVTNGKASSASEEGFSFWQRIENGRTVLRWKHANLELSKADEQEQVQVRARKAPDVQLTTFASWPDLARWESQIRRGAEQPSAEIAAKSAELTAGRQSNPEKMEALYDFVSSNIRIVDASFGHDRFRPQQPAAVLKNGYGDYDDAQALLAAMLEAAGFHAEPALLPSTRRTDLALPSPAQFDRALTVVPNGDNLYWLDAAAEVAPFGFLPPSLRGKLAFLVTNDGNGKIVKTPADPPFPSSQQVQIEGAVSDLGKLSATIHYSLRGDTEFVLRSAFHRAPQSQWSELAQTILALDGLHGEVSSVKTSDASDTKNPFELTIQFSQQNFLDWSSERTGASLPLLTIGLPDQPKTAMKAVELGSPLDVETRLSLKFPPQFSVQAPTGVAVSRDYADFKASYTFDKAELRAERSLNFKLRQLPAARAPDYLAFTHAVEADEMQLLAIENTAQDRSKIPANVTADDLFDAGTAALKAGNLRLAIPLLERVTQADPKHEHAWNDLGLAYFRVGKYEDAASAFKQQLQVKPSDDHANDYLGIALERLHRDDEAAAAFRAQIAINPLDTVAHAALGTLLLDEHDDPAAMVELEKATILTPENAELEVSLGCTYLDTGENEKALNAFHKAIDLSPAAPVWNHVAYELADHNLDLDEALKYAEAAVKTESQGLANLSLSHLAQSDFAHVSNLAAYWDTLGWVYFRRGDLQRASRYIVSAWRLGGRGSSCDHLAQVYERLGQRDRAIQTYALSIAAPQSNPETRARLMLLLGGNAQIDDLVAKSKLHIAESHTLVVKDLQNQDTAADFLLLFSALPKEGGTIGTQPDAVKFLTGSESLRSQADRLHSINYGEIFPEISRAKLLRRGTLACSAVTGNCTFTLLPAGDATLAN